MIRLCIFVMALVPIILGGCTRTMQQAPIVAGVSLPPKADADFRCADEPAPVPPGGLDEDDAIYKINLRHAWRDCRDKLGSVGVVWRATEAAQSRAIPPKGD